MRKHDSVTDPFREFAGMSVESACARVASAKGGLSSAEASRRLARVGPNDLATDTPKSALVLLARQFLSPLVGILVFAAVVSLIAREWTDAGVVLGIVVLSAVLSFTQELRATRAVTALRSRVARQSDVRRDGGIATVASSALVPGDVVVLAAGTMIPVDGLVLESNALQVDEAALTGETFPVEKRVETIDADATLSRCHGAVFAGTSVRSGSGEVLALVTGPRTVFGRVAERIEAAEDETDFERGVRRFGRMVSQVMVVLVGVVFVLDVVTDKPPIDSLLFAIAIAVGMAPEMLPAIITITLSSGAARMAERGVIVQRLSAIENLGTMDVLCTDKTGTLTKGVVALDSVVDARGADAPRARRLSFLNAWFETGFRNALDAAVIAHGEGLGERVLDARKLGEIPYDFTRKRLGIALEDRGTTELVVKGQLTHVVDVCDQERVDGALRPIDDARRVELRAVGDAHGAAGFRALGVASRSVDVRTSYSVADESGMTFEGLLLFSDPPKEGVGRVIAELAALGVETKMITGDGRAAAIHVLSQLGLDATRVLTASEIAGLSDAALAREAERATAFTEVDPSQKERIIVALRRSGRSVGYMGDGINDAPALHAADVGISVEGAVDVAKASADFVLLRPDLEVLRAGIEEGRRTFANTLKYVFTTTSANFGNMLSMACASAALPFLPLLAKQVLLNNFLSDIPAMTIAGDGVDEELVRRPRRWDIAEIRRFMIAFGATSSAFDILTFVFLARGVSVGVDGFRTGWFVESLLTELAIVFVVRTHRPLFRSRPGRALAGSSLVMAFVALALPYSPVAPAFDLVPLPLSVLATLVAITLAYVAVSERVKRRMWSAITVPVATSKVTGA